MKKLIVLFASVLLFFGCASSSDKECFFVGDECLEAQTSDTSNAVEEIKTPNFQPREIDEAFLEVEAISQFPRYPAGCETISAVMALRWIGEDVDTDEFIEKHLPQSSDFYWENGKEYGPDPYEYYLGTPYYKYSWGCMSPVIEKALVSYLEDDSRVKNTTGTDLDALVKTYVANGLPVIVWVTINMLDVVDEFCWYLQDGTLYNWPGNEHCMLLVGMDGENYYFNDPYRGARVSYPKEIVERRYEELGKQSVVVN